MRWAPAAAVLAVAVAFFAFGRSLGEPVRVTTTGTRYAVTVLIDEPVVEVRVDSGDADTVALAPVMPAMGHAVPEVVAREPEPGRFVARGELFPMTGVWELSIRLTGPSGAEVLVVSALIGE